MDPLARRWTSLALPAVMALVPFEPRRPTLPLGPFHVTMLEGAALVGLAVLAARARGEPFPVGRRGDLPLVLLCAFAAVELLSAVVSADAASVKFALRMILMAVFAVAVAWTDGEARRRALVALALGGGLASLLGVAEGVGVRTLDPALALFREMPFNVAGVRRATAGSEYPNLGAAGIAYGLLATVARAGARRWGPGRAAAVAVPFAAGLLYTYSRGALVALAAALVVAAAALGRADGTEPRPNAGTWPHAIAPAVALAVLAAVAGAFAVGGEVFQLRLASEGLQAWYGARYEPEARTLILPPGGATVTPVRVTNTGRKVWTREGQFHLSYHWYDVDRRVAMDGGRTVLPRALGPGESAVLAPEVRAPDRAGSYLLLWDMVQEHTSWFSGQGVAPAVVAVTVGGAPPPPAPSVAAPRPTGLAWRPGRGELWSLAIRMWRAHPLLGVGPDAFRRLYGPWSGHTWWDDRVYANNLFLEVAATAGTVAAGLLAASLVVGFRRAWSARTDPAVLAEAVAAACLIAFVLVHGLVDYVLAFTGHYLVAAFAVGAASALARRA